MTEKTMRTGGCLCGAIRYRATGEPVRTSICYCTQCRRQTGSAMPAFAVFPAAAVEIERGAPAGFAASAEAVREFCPSCGSPLFWRGKDGVYAEIFLGTLDEPGSLPAPARQIWTTHRLAWVTDIAAIRAWPEQGG
jgi:hypothetical protein